MILYQRAARRKKLPSSRSTGRTAQSYLIELRYISEGPWYCSHCLTRNHTLISVTHLCKYTVFKIHLFYKADNKSTRTSLNF